LFELHYAGTPNCFQSVLEIRVNDKIRLDPWTEFGGTREYKDEPDPLKCASRHASEESAGLLQEGDVFATLSRCPFVDHENYRLFFYRWNGSHLSEDLKHSPTPLKKTPSKTRKPKKEKNVHWVDRDAVLKAIEADVPKVETYSGKIKVSPLTFAALKRAEKKKIISNLGSSTIEPSRKSFS